MTNTSKVLIKIGGAALKDDSVLETVTQAIQRYRRNGHKVVVVHGGGPAINAELTRAGLAWNFIDGQRVTTPEMMDVIESTLSGQVNRKLVRYMGGMGLPVMGFSGTDNHTLMCVQADERLGQVGQIKAVNCAWIEVLMRLPSAPVPIMAPVGIGMEGEAFNINADWAATKLAGALGVQQLIFLTDQDGIWDANKQIVSQISTFELEDMIENKVVEGGMLTKVKAILHARKNGINTVRVLNGNDALEAVNNLEIGTICAAPPPVPEKRRMDYVTA